MGYPRRIKGGFGGDLGGIRTEKEINSLFDQTIL